MYKIGASPNWNNGIVEYWNDGFEGHFDNLNRLFPLFFPIFQHFILPCK
jgi:hypothetical protein